MSDDKQEVPIDSFQFSLKVADYSLRDIDLQLDAMERRIDRIVSGVQLSSHIPVLQSILGVVQDKDELEMLGKALIRLGPLMEQVSLLKTKKQTISLAIQDPQWVAATFGDFSSDIERLIYHTEPEEQ